MRRECLDHLLVLTGAHLRRALKEYTAYFNQARPHQGVGQRVPQPVATVPSAERGGTVVAIPVLNGLHHNYQHAA
ncbi:MAG: transposase [Chloroflexota bacterium]|nr:transposase [Chloroflexota bacterium]